MGGPLIHTDARFAQSVEDAVTAIEAHTEAEVVVVAAARSGSYRDVELGIGVGLAWLGLALALYSSWDFSGLWLPLELPLLAVLGFWIGRRWPGLVARLTSSERRARQAQQAAHAAFFEEAVHATRGRTGLLIYVSALEDRVVLLADEGIEVKVPHALWNDLRWGDQLDPACPGDLDHFLAGLARVGEVLAERVPASGDNPNEIHNAPRIRA